MLEIILVLVVIGFVLWFVTTAVPMPATYRQLVIGLVCILVLFWLFGRLGMSSGVRVP